MDRRDDRLAYLPPGAIDDDLLAAAGGGMPNDKTVSDLLRRPAPRAKPPQPRDQPTGPAPIRPVYDSEVSAAREDLLDARELDLLRSRPNLSEAEVYDLLKKERTRWEGYPPEKQGALIEWARAPEQDDDGLAAAIKALAPQTIPYAPREQGSARREQERQDYLREAAKIGHALNDDKSFDVLTRGGSASMPRTTEAEARAAGLIQDDDSLLMAAAGRGIEDRLQKTTLGRINTFYDDARRDPVAAVGGLIADQLHLPDLGSPLSLLPQELQPLIGLTTDADQRTKVAGEVADFVESLGESTSVGEAMAPDATALSDEAKAPSITTSAILPDALEDELLTAAGEYIGPRARYALEGQLDAGVALPSWATDAYKYALWNPESPLGHGAPGRWLTEKTINAREAMGLLAPEDAAPQREALQVLRPKSDLDALGERLLGLDEGAAADRLKARVAYDGLPQRARGEMPTGAELRAMAQDSDWYAPLREAIEANPEIDEEALQQIGADNPMAIIAAYARGGADDAALAELLRTGVPLADVQRHAPALYARMVREEAIAAALLADETATLTWGALPRTAKGDEGYRDRALHEVYTELYRRATEGELTAAKAPGLEPFLAAVAGGASSPKQIRVLTDRVPLAALPEDLRDQLLTDEVLQQVKETAAERKRMKEAAGGDAYAGLEDTLRQVMVSHETDRATGIRNVNESTVGWLLRVPASAATELVLELDVSTAHATPLAIPWLGLSLLGAAGSDKAALLADAFEDVHLPTAAGIEHTLRSDNALLAAGRDRLGIAPDYRSFRSGDESYLTRVLTSLSVGAPGAAGHYMNIAEGAGLEEDSDWYAPLQLTAHAMDWLMPWEEMVLGPVGGTAKAASRAAAGAARFPNAPTSVRLRAAATATAPRLYLHREAAVGNLKKLTDTDYFTALNHMAQRLAMETEAKGTSPLDHLSDADRAEVERAMAQLGVDPAAALADYDTYLQGVRAQHLDAVRAVSTGNTPELQAVRSGAAYQRVSAELDGLQQIPAGGADIARAVLEVTAQRAVAEGRVPNLETFFDQLNFADGGAAPTVPPPGALAQGGVVDGPVFFSQLRRTLEEKMGRKPMAPPQVLRLLGQRKGEQWVSRAGVREDELAWSGIEDWLQDKADADEKVSRSEVLNFLDENAVEIEEVIQGAPDSDLQPHLNTLSTITQELNTAIADGAVFRFQRNPTPKSEVQVVRFDDSAVYYRNPTDDALERVGLTTFQRRLVEAPPEQLARLKQMEVAHRTYQTARQPSAVRYPGYVEPGGSNVRELLLKQSGSVRPLQEGDLRADWSIRQEGDSWSVHFVDGAVHDVVREGLASDQSALRWLKQNHPGAFHDIAPERPAFTTGHWPGHEDILAHVRFTERTGPDGERVLFIEEIQSDAHQDGRRSGYGRRDPDPAETRGLRQQIARDKQQHQELAGEVAFTSRKLMTSLESAMGEQPLGILATPSVVVRYYDETLPATLSTRLTEKVPALTEHAEQLRELALAHGRAAAEHSTLSNRLSETEAALSERETRLGLATDDNELVPPLPLKRRWPLFAIKRMLRWAADHDFDRVAWTPGKTQDARYSVRGDVQHMDASDWFYGDEDASLQEARKAETLREAVSQALGRAAENNTRMDPEEAELALIELIEDHLEEIDSGGAEAAANVADLHRLLDTRGQGAIVDPWSKPSGMVAFYDQRLPKDVARYVKRWGSKPRQVLQEQVVPDSWGIHWADGQGPATAVDYPTPAAAEAQMQKLGEQEAFSETGLVVRPTTSEALPAWLIDITPAMRQSVKRGQPLWQRKRGKARGSFEDRGPDGAVLRSPPERYQPPTVELSDDGEMMVARSADGEVLGVATSEEGAQQLAEIHQGLRHTKDYSPSTVGVVDLTMDQAAVESAIQGESIEHGVLFNREGRQLYRIMGSETKIAVDWSRIGHVEDTPGGRLTHNHPTGAYLSSVDVVTGIVLQLDELAAVTPQGHAWRLQAPPKGWGSNAPRPASVEHDLLQIELQDESRSAYMRASKRIHERILAAGGDPNQGPGSSGWPPAGYDEATWKNLLQEETHAKIQTWLDEHYPGARILLEGELPGGTDGWAFPIDQGTAAHRLQQAAEVQPEPAGRSGLPDEQGNGRAVSRLEDAPEELTDPDDPAQLQLFLEQGGLLDGEGTPLTTAEGAPIPGADGHLVVYRRGEAGSWYTHPLDAAGDGALEAAWIAPEKAAVQTTGERGVRIDLDEADLLDRVDLPDAQRFAEAHFSTFTKKKPPPPFDATAFKATMPTESNKRLTWARQKLKNLTKGHQRKAIMLLPLAERRVIRAEMKANSTTWKAAEIPAKGRVPSVLAQQARFNRPTTKTRISSTTKMKHAAGQLQRVDAVRQLFGAEGPLTNNRDWRLHQYLLTGDSHVVKQPYRVLAYRDEPDLLPDFLSQQSRSQWQDAQAGMAQAQEFKALYHAGAVPPEVSAKLLLWGILSRGQSVYPHEAAFLDLIAAGVDQWIGLALQGRFTEDTLVDYLFWVDDSFPADSPGRQSKSNANDFGTTLFKMGQPLPDGHTYAGRSALSAWHKMLSDPTLNGRQIRRRWVQLVDGPGIGLKVVSFLTLVVGHQDVLVLDRVQARHLWEGRARGDGRTSEYQLQNVYDSYSGPSAAKRPLLPPNIKLPDGTLVQRPWSTASGLTNLLSGVRGIALYEALEDAMQAPVARAYARIGRAEHGTLGSFHWESWVLESMQEAGHATIASLLREARGKAEPMAGTYVRQGRHQEINYGQFYVDRGNKRGRSRVMITSDGRPFLFDGEAWAAFQKTLKKSASNKRYRGQRIVPHGFKITQHEGPWWDAPGVDRGAADALIERLGAPPDSADAEFLGQLAADEQRRRAGLQRPGGHDGTTAGGSGEEQPAIAADPRGDAGGVAPEADQPSVLLDRVDGATANTTHTSGGGPLYQRSPAGHIRGTFQDDPAAATRYLITLFNSGDFNTLLHEMGHLIEVVFPDLATEAAQHFDVDQAGRLSPEGREQFAEALRYYLRHRTAPDGPTWALMERAGLALQHLVARIPRVGQHLAGDPLLPRELAAQLDGVFRPDRWAARQASQLQLPPTKLPRVQIAQGRAPDVDLADSTDLRASTLLQALDVAPGDDVVLPDLVAGLIGHIVGERARARFHGVDLQRLTTRSIVPTSRIGRIQREASERLIQALGVTPEALAATATGTADATRIPLNPTQAAGLKAMANEIAALPMGDIVPQRLMGLGQGNTYITPQELTALQEAVIDTRAGVHARRTRAAEAVPTSIAYAMWQLLVNVTDSIGAEVPAVAEATDSLTRAFRVRNPMDERLHPEVRELVDARLREMGQAHTWALDTVRGFRKGNPTASLRHSYEALAGVLVPPVPTVQLSALGRTAALFSSPPQGPLSSWLTPQVLARVDGLLGAGNLEEAVARRVLHSYTTWGPSQSVTRAAVADALEVVRDGLLHRQQRVHERARELGRDLGGQRTTKVWESMRSRELEQLYRRFYDGQWDAIIADLTRRDLMADDPATAWLAALVRLRARAITADLVDDLATYGVTARASEITDSRPMGSLDRQAFIGRVRDHMDDALRSQPARAARRPARGVTDADAWRTAQELLVQWGVAPNLDGGFSWVDLPNGERALMPSVVKMSIDETLDRVAAVGRNLGSAKSTTLNAANPNAHVGLSLDADQRMNVYGVMQELIERFPLTPSRIREGVTVGPLVPNPGYTVGNMVGAAFQVYQGRGAAGTITATFEHPKLTSAITGRMVGGPFGEGVRDFLFAEGAESIGDVSLPNPLLVTADGRIYDAAQLAQLAEAHGLNTSFIYAESAKALTEDIARMHRPFWRKMMSTPDYWQELLIETNTAVDNWFRIGTFVDELADGASPAAAAAKARQVGFDYGALTDFERGFMRQAVMFYSYMRRNADLFVWTMAHHPHRVLGQLRLMKGVLEENLEEEPQIVWPEHYDGRLAVQFKTALRRNHASNQVATVAPPLPVADALLIGADFLDLAASFGTDPDATGGLVARVPPWWQFFPTMATEKDIFFQRDLDEGATIPDWYVALDRAWTGGLLVDHVYLSQRQNGKWVATGEGAKYWWVARSLAAGVPGHGRNMATFTSTDRANLGAMESLIDASRSANAHFLGPVLGLTPAAPIPTGDTSSPRPGLTANDELFGLLAFKPIPVPTYSAQRARDSQDAILEMNDATKSFDQSGPR